METVEWHIRQMETELRQWGERLDKLMEKADAAGTEAKIDYRNRLDELSEKYAAAQARLSELKAAGTNKWDTHRGGVESAWSELATAFTKLAN
jgi:predicted  nucleic acid-binding Zn-ribbon protein